MQLVAYGAQDIYLTGNPQITFFKVVYRRHTNFSMECIEQTFNGTVGAGASTVTATVSRNGDLISNMHLDVLIAGEASGASAHTYVNYTNNTGHAFVDFVELEIGGQRIDKHYGHWLDAWNELTDHDGNEAPLVNKHSAKNAYLRSATATGNLQLYVPLKFWFNRNPGLALPLIALQYHEVKINIEIRPLDECLFAVKSVTPVEGDGNQKVNNAYAKSLVAASLYVDYVFLDTDERRRMAQNPHEYLIEQLQFTGDESIGSSSNKIKLNFNHPCKEIVWVVQPDMHVAYCDSFLGGRLMHRALGAQPFNYTDAVDALPDSILAFGSSNQTRGAQNAVIDGSGLFNDTISFDVSGTVNNSSPQAAGAQISPAATASVNQSSNTAGSVADASLGGAINGAVSNGLTDAGVFVLAETALNMHCWGENPVVTAKLQLNGQDRFSEREGTYFDLVQPYQHHTRNPDTGINVYSFALRPEEHQPSGTCNFSRIDNATLQLVVSAAAIGGTQTAKVRVYATNYNVLRVMSGMGGLAYSN